MPIGKYIYCTACNKVLEKPSKAESQMPIGKYIYCTQMGNLWIVGSNLSQMPIGKYIYCTRILGFGATTDGRWGHKCLSASTFTVPAERVFPAEYKDMSQMPIGKYIYCTSDF